MTDHVHPGEKCPSCERRVPFPRRDSTPQSKVVAYRVPSADVDAHAEVLEAAAVHLGAYGRPYWQFWTYTFALAAVLQDASLGNAANPTSGLDGRSAG